MLVKVIVKSSSKLDTTFERTFEVPITPRSTALDVKERVSSLSDIFAFPKKSLLFKGNVLGDSDHLHTVGVAEGDVLELLFEPCEQTFVKQLIETLGESVVSVEELKLMYIHRYGSSTEDVLRRLGFLSHGLQKYLEDQKCFRFVDGFVKLSQTIDFGTQPVECSTITVKASVEWITHSRFRFSFSDDDVEPAPLCLDGSITVANARKIIAAAELVPFPDQDLLLHGRKLKDELSLRSAGVKDGDSLVLAVRASEATLVSQFEQLLRERSALSSNELSLLYCQRFGTSVSQALRSLGLHVNIHRFLENHQTFNMVGGCVTNSVCHDYRQPQLCA